MTKIPYARVSTTDQDTEIQTDRLLSAGCSIVRKEKVGGKSREGRDELAGIMEFIRDGDELVVMKLDRLGRSTRDVPNLVHELEQKGASLRVLAPEFVTSNDTGRVLVTVLGTVAEMERNFISSRQQAGIEAAKAAGISKGRKPSGRPGASVDSRWRRSGGDRPRTEHQPPVCLSAGCADATDDSPHHLRSGGAAKSRPSVAWVSAYQSSRVKGLPPIVPVPNPAQRLLQEI
jgi:DNA invertase Pin-like site-specific DNA recombinase